MAWQEILGIDGRVCPGLRCQHKPWRLDVYEGFMAKSSSGELMVVFVLIAGDYFLLGIVVVVIHPHRHVRMDPDD
jgi:hypothetical protein